jgi:hypothetical protein
MDKNTNILTQINELEEEKHSLQKKKRLWEEYLEQWAYLQQEEQTILEEVAYLSHGTISENHATQQLSFFDEERQMMSRTFDAIDEGFEQREKAIHYQEDQLTAAYYEAKKQEDSDDDEI